MSAAIPSVGRSAAAPSLPAVLASLRARQPRLAAFGLACLLAGLVTASLTLFDPRMLGGESVWLKPAKFFVSIGVFALTSAWFFGFVRPKRRNATPLRVGIWMLIGASGFELAYITLQAARAQASHFNTGDPVHGALYALMGLGALTLLGSKIPLAIEIARRPAAGIDPGLRMAVVLGLGATVLLGGLTGIQLSLHAGHAVGTAGPGLPLTGWNRSGGDLRVAHFLGMHAEQVLPILAGLAALLHLPKRRRLAALAAATWAGLTLFALLQARMGLAFPFG